jgi:hypothetical protein
MVHTSLHRIVAFTFLGPPPSDGQEYTVDHVNRNKEDNRVLNLRWATPHEQLDNREFYHYTLHAADGRTFSSIAAFSKEMNTSEKMVREKLRQTLEGDVVIFNGVQILVQTVQRAAMKDVSDRSFIQKYGGRKKTMKQRDVALGLFLEGNDVGETAEAMGLKVDTVVSYLATAARESTRPSIVKLAERLGVGCPFRRQQLQDDILEYNTSFCDQAEPYDVGYQRTIMHRLPDIAGDWRVIRGVFQAVYHMLK